MKRLKGPSRLPVIEIILILGRQNREDEGGNDKIHFYTIFKKFQHEEHRSSDRNGP